MILVYSLLILSTFILCVLLVNTIGNIYFVKNIIPRNSYSKGTFKFSVLIPARNESHRITQTITSVLAQTYKNFELIILDDNSNDSTYDVCSTLIINHTAAKVCKGKVLEDEWVGKNFACWQLSEMATGDYLLFIDADVVLKPFVLESIAYEIESLTTPYDLVTCFPQQICCTWGERLIVPLVDLFLYSCAPIFLFGYSDHSLLSAANGQFIFFNKEYYFKIGGHKSVRSNIVEDMALARLVKKNSGRLELKSGYNSVECRMYTCWQEILIGFGKNCFAASGFKSINYLIFCIFFLLVLFSPFVLFYFSFLSLIPITQIFLLRALSARRFGYSVQDAILYHPASVLCAFGIFIYSWLWSFYGKPTWKGRAIKFTLLR
jgi:glycosyltransferase involved in cell wall biosynthesis